MEKAIPCSMNCPFSHRACIECGIYRGRHHYMALAGRLRGHTRAPGDHVGAYFQALEQVLEPWAQTNSQGSAEPDVRLKVVDMESGKAKICEFEDARTWDWNNPEIMRLIEGWQVKSYDGLIDMARYKAGKGDREVEVREFPRFMLLSGG
jgi:hypothetical protein